MTSTNEHIEQEKEPQLEPGPKQKQPKKRIRRAKETLNDPMKIIESVLAKSSFKVPNLSQIVEEKFYKAPDYNKEIRDLLKNVRYKSTVGPDVEISILPHGFDGRVNLPEMAITELACIHKQINQTKGRKGRKKTKKRIKNKPKDIDNGRGEIGNGKSGKDKSVIGESEKDKSGAEQSC